MSGELEPVWLAEGGFSIEPQRLDGERRVLDLTSDLTVTASATFEISPADHAQWMRWLFGPGLPRAKSVDEQRWEDDGGPAHVDCEGYDHVVTAVGAVDWP